MPAPSSACRTASSSCCSGCCRWPWAISAWRCGGGRGRRGGRCGADMTALDALLRWLGLAGIAGFAASGALGASRQRVGGGGFLLIAAVTGFGGGTLRDLLLGRTPPFWLRDPTWLAVASSVALVVFFTAPRIESRFRALLWADAVGLALFAVLGAEIALLAGARPW